jgi:hypothetical protein
MFASGQVACAVVVALFVVSGLARELVWRVVLGLGAVPALAILTVRENLPQATIRLIREGRFREVY